MKIGMVSRFGEKDGIAIYSDNLVEALRKEGCEIITIGGKNSKSDYKVDLQSIRLKYIIADIILKEKLQLVHFQHIAERSYYGAHTLNLNFIHALSQKVPAAVTLHELHYLARNVKEHIVSKIEKAIIKKAAWIIVHTKGQQKFLQKKGCENATVIRMGVKTRPMHKLKGKNILFFGMISKAKGVNYLLEAMKLMPEFKLTVAGRIVEKSTGKKLMENPPPNATLKFGWVDEEEKNELFHSNDILAMPYTDAPYQSAVLHDAMSYGLPVIVTRTGSIHDIVEEFNCGQVIEPANAKAISNAAKHCIENYSDYQKGIENYRKIANWQKSAQDHINVYKRLT